MDVKNNLDSGRVCDKPWIGQIKQFFASSRKRVAEWTGHVCSWITRICTMLTIKREEIVQEQNDNKIEP